MVKGLGFRVRGSGFRVQGALSLVSTLDGVLASACSTCVDGMLIHDSWVGAFMIHDSWVGGFMVYGL